MLAASAPGEMEDPNPFSRSALKPIIKEIVRTRICFANIQLLLDRIIVVNISHAADRDAKDAFRLYLSDGEKSIQALVQRRLYRMMISHEVCEGSFLHVKEYSLASARRTVGEGNITFIVLNDFYPIGYDGRSPQESWTKRIISELSRGRAIDDQMYEVAGLLPKRRISAQRGHPTSELSVSLGDQDQEDLRSSVQGDGICKGAISAPEPKKRKRDTVEVLGEIDPNSQSSPSKSARISMHDQDRTLVVDDDKKPNEAGCLEPARPPEAMQSCANQASSNPPICTSEPLLRANFTDSRPTSRSGAPPRPINAPLRLISLGSLNGYHRRNDVYDVFAVIYSVGDTVVKRSRMPAKRDIYIVDPSTEKKVLLSVFVDPLNFKPDIGQVALMRNLTTHEWNGGMLNAYPKQCEGKEWFIRDPQNVPGCDTDFLREWWTDKVIEEAEERMRAEQLGIVVASEKTEV